MNRRTLPILLCLLFLCATAAAQPKEGKQILPPKEIAGKGKAATDPETERILRERRAQAQSLLISLAADAGSYSDQKLRARTQARIADVLWDADPERARTLFRRAWDRYQTATSQDWKLRGAGTTKRSRRSVATRRATRSRHGRRAVGKTQNRKRSGSH